MATIALLGVVQAGPGVWIVVSQDRMAGFDWVGYISYQTGSLAVPLLIGCLGLLFRRNPGLGFFLLSVAMFVFLTIGSLVP